MKLRAKKIEKVLKNIKVYSFSRVDSTNILVKAFAEDGAQEGTVAVATKQTAGKGRLGRTFLSPQGGVYFSVILRPQSTQEDILFITVAAAVAAARAIDAVSGKKCEIKWVNDIYLNGKKICGILTEGAFNADGTLKYAVLGVGINLFEPKGGFPLNLPLAGSVFAKKFNVFEKRSKKEQVVILFLTKFFEFYNDLSQKNFIKEYQERSFLTGKEITYIKDGTTYKAVVEGIDNSAGLVVKTDCGQQVLSHGEIQIVGMEQPEI